jgi:hypothetical protein
MNPTENAKAKGKVPALKLKRETLRELDATELKQAQGARPTYYCVTIDQFCTRACPKTKKCTG